MLRIGTSGWQYRDWRERFYPRPVPASRWLDYYATRFDTVEVNSTFYRLPAPKTFADWAARVPDGFEFAIKASRYLTHFKRLHEPEEPVERLMTHAAPLRARIGVVLLQLPPDLKCAPSDLDRTLRAFAGRVRIAVEPRHGSWWNDEVRAVLEAHSAALCLADRGSRVVTPLWRTADWAYVRFHFGRAQPSSCYGIRALTTWKERLSELFGRDADGYVYFNNDAHGCAVRDAATFIRLTSRSGTDMHLVAGAPSAPRDTVGGSELDSSEE
ncbi:MAG: DUF72 domain-containing protein [Actinomycetota bacterium]|nr:DUF72 domain-containing protein [Actinomycetota bacterium]